jgi:hypothetical protein
MRNIAHLPVKFICQGVAVLLISSLALNAAVPPGWYLAGSKPADYEAGVDAQAKYNGHSSAYLRAKTPNVEGFGTLMQDFRADRYLGKKVRLSGFVRTEHVNGWAGLWMRVDNGPTQVAFDNMQDRPIKGTSEWKSYVVVLDVPEDATGIAFGVLLAGSGSVWLNSVKFEVVGSDVPTTAAPPEQRPTEPTNLDFND